MLYRNASAFVSCLSLFALLIPSLCPAADEVKAITPEKLHVVVPKGVDQSLVSIRGGSHGLRGIVGDHAKLSDDGTYVFSEPDIDKAIIYVPGYKTVKVDLRDQPNKTLVSPAYERLAQVSVKIKLIDINKKPLPKFEFHVSFYSSVEDNTFLFPEMKMMSGPPSIVHPISATTDENGEAEMTLPYFVDDPFYAGRPKYNPMAYWLDVAIMDRVTTVEDRYIPIQRSYPTPLTYTVVKYGEVTFKADSEYRRNHGAQGNRWPIDIQFKPAGVVDTRNSGSTGYTDAHDRMICHVKPGVYDVSVAIYLENKHKELFAAKNVVVEEGSGQTIELK